MIGLKRKGRSSVREENMDLFQNFNLIDELSVYDNIELPLIYNKRKGGRKKIKSKSNC
jgi:putative ABC transport system ATP-binding protein